MTASCLTSATRKPKPRATVPVASPQDRVSSAHSAVVNWLAKTVRELQCEVLKLKSRCLPLPLATVSPGLPISIFEPLQFGGKEEKEKYPDDWDLSVELAVVTNPSSKPRKQVRTSPSPR